MNLEQALITYGLKPRPTSQLDWLDWRQIDPSSDDDLDRVTMLVADLDRRFFNQVEVQLTLIGNQGESTSSIRFEGVEQLAAQHEFRWAITDDLRRRHRWTCGVVEASYRRLLLAVSERNDGGPLADLVDAACRGFA